MSAATKKAIEEIEGWSAKVTKDPEALGNKLKAERKLFSQILGKVRQGLLALNYGDWVMIEGTHLGYLVSGDRISVFGGYGDRRVEDIITGPGDFERLVQTLNRNVKQIRESLESPR